MAGILDIFTVGETVGVVASLNKNFATLLALLQQQSSGQCVGTSSMQAAARINFEAIGSATGNGTLQASQNQKNQFPATATGTSIVTATGASTAQVDAVITGTSVAGATTTSASVASMSGTATVAATGISAILVGASATGSDTVVATGSSSAQATGAATGTSAVAAQPAQQVESATGTSAAQPTQTVFASPNPGQAATQAGGVNTFKLSAQPGQLVFNTAIDTATTNATEIFYTNHTLFYQNLDNTWFQWTAPHTYVVVTSPIPTPINESPEGFVVNSTSQTMYASSTPGVAAASTATVGNGLIAFTLTAAPPNAQIALNQGTGSAIDTTTSNVKSLFYHNHTMYQQNNAQLWFRWISPGVYNNETGSPVPSLQSINVATVADQAVNTTFVVSGSLSGYPTTVPTLNYQDKTGSFSALPSTTNVKINGDGTGSFSFVHPPVANIDASFTVSVRDANSIGTSAATNVFKLFNPGVINLINVSLTNASFTAGTPAGTVVGSIVVGITGGTFTGTGQNGGLTVSPSTQFSINGTNLVTSAVLGVGTYPLVITASQTSTVGSPVQTGVNVIANPIVESTEGTSVLASGTGTIFGSPVVGTQNVLTGPGSGNASDGTLKQYTIVGGVIATNGSTTGSQSSGVTQIYYHQNTLWQFNGTNWFSMRSDGVSYNGPVASPLPSAPTITVQPIRNVFINTVFTVQGVLQNYSAAPNIQYMDKTTGAWVSVAASVTANSFAFTHPGVASPDGAFTVAVRDAANTSIVGTSNMFQVCLTAANNLGTNPAGFVITDFNIATTATANSVYSSTITAIVSGAPRFTGTYQLTSVGSGPGLDDNLFTVSNNVGTPAVAGNATVQSASALAANTDPGYHIQITATM